MKPGHARLLVALLLTVTTARGTDQFGDISVDASAIYTGSTFHGYAETRVLLSNLSTDKAHVVTLISPNDDVGNMGNSIGRMTRTVTVGANASQVVTLLQPPLPSRGDSMIRVEVDNRHEGEVHCPNANSHCNYYWRGGNQSAAVFVSRNLNFNSVERVYRAKLPFSAVMAVGPPDVGSPQNAWIPDRHLSGGSSWLELD